ncbi:hypothetical protein OSB04_007927 [Centaurea solstitialis]|uniref:Reverse transcriptase zinc-binding domain-containing protein n=1 Tax=Centaurea solstitialis TaxID=347529 RepID=A0AA38U418_9ASTR|nr:hypothetical protein OSB04_007927 [Centaurea solstitialis]
MGLWNRALLTTHVYDVLRRKKSLWVSWIYIHRLHNVHFWNAPIISNSSWIWRKLLELREQVRPFFLSYIGDGKTVNAWEDKWILLGSLSSLIPYRFFHREGFNKSSKVEDVVRRIGSNWPQSWTIRCPNFSNVTIPTLQNDILDRVSWLNLNQQVRPFMVKEVWEVFLGNQETVFWYDLCWFKNYVPKHSFCFWLAILDKLPTQVRMAKWLPNGDSLRCPLCSQASDSRDHLFFQCDYSNAVWSLIRTDIGCSLDGV